MKGMLLVGLGGFAGSIARYKLGGLVLHLTAQGLPSQSRFPWSTFAINVLGCLLAGLLAALAEEHDVFSPDARLLVFTGLLGGFTTFSAFGLDGLFLLRRGETATALLYAGGSVVVGLAAAWVGFRLVGLWPR